MTMGILDFIAKAQESLMAKAQERLNDAQKKIDDLQKRIETTPLESIFEKPKAAQDNAAQKQSRTAKRIIKRFYADYPEQPYISNERKEDWIEKAELFPKQCIIPKSMMERYSDGLLPGHIYMLYWLKRYTNKNVPTYFEYKYGLDFDKERTYLRENGYLDAMHKPTQKGEEAITKHFDVIQDHTKPKPDRTIEGISAQIIAQRDSLKSEGIKEYTFIANSNCCEICAKLNEKHFLVSELKIGVNAPPMHDGCRCSIAAYFDRKEYDDWLNNL